MLSRTLLSLGVAAAAAGVPLPEASTAPAPNSERHALRGATDHSSPEREAEKRSERRASHRRGAAHYDPGEQQQQGEQAEQGPQFDWKEYASGAGGYMQGGNFDWQQYGGQSSGDSSVELGAHRGASVNATKQNATGFNSWLQEMLPPGDAGQYVDRWTGTWSDMTAPQESMYSSGSQGYSQYVDRYKSMAGRHPSAAGSWQDKMDEQRTAYGTAVGQDFPGNAHNHWQEGSTSEASSATHKSQSATSSDREARQSTAKTASEPAASGASTALQQVTPPRGEVAVELSAKEAVGRPAANEVGSTHSSQEAAAHATDAPRAAKNDSNHSHQEVSADSQHKEKGMEEEQKELKQEDTEEKEEREEEAEQEEDEENEEREEEEGGEGGEGGARRGGEAEGGEADRGEARARQARRSEKGGPGGRRSGGGSARFRATAAWRGDRKQACGQAHQRPLATGGGCAPAGRGRGRAGARGQAAAAEPRYATPRSSRGRCGLRAGDQGARRMAGLYDDQS